MSLNKKKRWLIGSVSCGTILSAVAIPVLIFETHIPATNTDLHYAQSFASKVFKEPVKLDYVDGMKHDEKQYDQLIEQRIKSLKINTLKNFKGDITSVNYVTNDITFSIEKNTLDEMHLYLSDEQIKTLIIGLNKMLIANVENPNARVKQPSFFVTITDTDDWKVGDTSASNLTIRLFINQMIKSLMYILDSNKEMRNEAKESTILMNIVRVVFAHEMGHALQNTKNSRFIIWNSGNNATKMSIMGTQSTKHYWNLESNIPKYQNLFYSMKRPDIFLKIMNFLRGEGDQKSYHIEASSHPWLPIEPIIQKYYPTNSPIINSKLYQDTKAIGADVGLEGYRYEIFSESLTRLISNYWTLYDSWNDVLVGYNKGLGEQIDVSRALSWNPYPMDTSFSRKFMAEYLKTFLGIGDINTIRVVAETSSTDTISFNGISTALSKHIKLIRFVYPDGTYDMPMNTRLIPVGWNFQPWTVGESFYKYVADQKYGSFVVPHHDSKPTKIIFLDRNNEELVPNNVQLLQPELLAGSNDGDLLNVRYMYDDQQQQWVEKYME